MKSILKSFIITSLFVLATINTFSQTASKEVSITASGSGKTLEDAKQASLRSATEQAFGAFISSKKEMFNAYLVQFVNSSDFLMGCGQGYKSFGDIVPITNKFTGGAENSVFHTGAAKIGNLEKVNDNPPYDGGYNGGGRVTSGPKTADKAAKARRKKRNQ